jgi:general secretion pathway protein G
MVVIIGFVLVIGLNAVGCSKDRPTEAQGKSAILDKLNESAPNSGGAIKLLSFRKTNGQDLEVNGVKMYKMEYECEIEKSGQRTKETGSITFEKTENGWRAMADLAESFGRSIKNADKDAARALVEQTCHAIDIYYIKMGVYPSSEDGLKALITPPADQRLRDKWNATAPFLKDNKVPLDPWGHELKYELVQTTGGTGSTVVQTGPPYHVWSTGPSGQDGGDDNIRNWDPNATN